MQRTREDRARLNPLQAHTCTDSGEECREEKRDDVDAKWGGDEDALALCTAEDAAVSLSEGSYANVGEDKQHSDS